MKYALIRLPSTMEDEGRGFLIGLYPTKRKARKAKKEYDGYYRHTIYKVCGS